MNHLQKELAVLERKEQKLLEATQGKSKMKENLYNKVPETLCTTLESAFTKAFGLVFLKGTQAIEKTFNKEDATMDFEASNFIVDKMENRKSIHRLDKMAKKKNLLNNTVTTASGLGMGILGMGLPDIPVLVSTLLKGIYEVSLGYGFDYETDEERIYILRLIRTALAADGNEKQAYNQELDSMNYKGTSLYEEIKLTAKVLSDRLLVEKFIQGIPIVGVVGGVVNLMVYTKTSAMAGVKYKKRYLLKKLELIE